MNEDTFWILVSFARQEIGGQFTDSLVEPAIPQAEKLNGLNRDVMRSLLGDPKVGAAAKCWRDEVMRVARSHQRDIDAET